MACSKIGNHSRHDSQHDIWLPRTIFDKHSTRLQDPFKHGLSVQRWISLYYMYLR